MFLNSKVVDNTLDLLTMSAYSSQQLFTVVRIELTPHVTDLSCGLPVILLTESGLCASFLYIRDLPSPAVLPLPHTLCDLVEAVDS